MATQPPTQPDESLTPKEYVNLGMPEPDRIWLSRDMEKAADVLTALVKSNPRALPRYRSARSGPVFARITSPDTYLLRAGFLPSAWVTDVLGRYVEANFRVMKLYLSARLTGGAGVDEEIEVYGSILRAAAATLGAYEDVLLTTPADDPSYRTRLAGMDRMKSVAATYAGLALDIVGDRVTHGLLRGPVGGDDIPREFDIVGDRLMLGQAERVRLLGHMRSTFPHLVPQLPPDSRTRIARRLQAMSTDVTNADLQPGLRQLAADTAAALRDTSGPAPGPTPTTQKK